MKIWTKEERYRRLKPFDIPDLKRENSRIEKSIYRQKFHIQPLTGLLNDPNGFCFFEGNWHLFYQWFPFGAVHGLKYWYHLVSKDLICWKNQGLALSPDTIFDNKGVYSGSAYIEDGSMSLIYTGNHRDKDDIRHPYQCIAKLEEKTDKEISRFKIGSEKENEHPREVDNKEDYETKKVAYGEKVESKNDDYIEDNESEDTADKKYIFVKKSHPIISESKHFTEHQRDPRVIFDEKNKEYVLIIGAQNLEKKGRILVYKSKELYSGWTEFGELKIKGYEDFGYMWECPDLLKLGEKHILIFSPQGLGSQESRFNNIYQNGYLIGKMDFDNLEFTVETDFLELDLGFDFYAAQSSAQDKFKEKEVLIGWMGLPDSNYPTDEEDWSGCLTLPRILSIRDGRLIQKPVDVSKIKNERVISGQIKKIFLEYKDAYNMKICDIDSSFEIRLFAKENELFDSGFRIYYDNNLKKFDIDRSKMDKSFNSEYGMLRSAILEEKISSIEVFVDKSSVEIFINEGEYVMTSRLFPTEEECFINIDSDDFIKTDMWKIEDIRDREFVI